MEVMARAERMCKTVQHLHATHDVFISLISVSLAFLHDENWAILPFLGKTDIQCPEEVLAGTRDREVRIRDVPGKTRRLATLIYLLILVNKSLFFPAVFSQSDNSAVSTDCRLLAWLTVQWMKHWIPHCSGQQHSCVNHTDQCLAVWMDMVETCSPVIHHTLTVTLHTSHNTGCSTSLVPRAGKIMICKK